MLINFSKFRDENEVVPQVVDALLQVPDTAHAAVRHTTLLLLGELSEWIDKHPATVGQCNTTVFLGIY